jgi:4-aminobutyrate aminotransferase/(S)-3-amino-2-methylpropionate transaminase
MTASPTGIEQRRELVTEIPGPRSKELHDRRTHAVSAGLTVGLPVYIDRAQGAILVDVDGNRLIDLGSGIAVTPCPR